MTVQPGSSPADAYEIRRFRAAPATAPDFGVTEQWIRAVNYGFYEKAIGEEHLAKIAQAYLDDDRELTGAYETLASGSPAFGHERPVATFGTLRETLNVGHGQLVQAHLVTAVTVRSDHRRRGLLRRLMGEDLARAKADGVAIAALTASEASIYRRFGYGVATRERRITVTTGPQFRLAVPTSGRVIAAEPSAMLDLAPKIFARAHRATPGSVDRQERYRLRAAGQWDHETGGTDAALRVAVHLDDDGTADGYAAYSFRGWDHEPATVSIRDLVAATPEAYLGLWDYLGSLDLIRSVEWDEAPVEDPLAWALVDPRAIRLGVDTDMLWLRILDVEAALGARHFAHDGELVLRVEDPLGFTTGTYRLAVSAGRSHIERLADDDTTPGDLALDIAELSSVYVGGVSPVTLAEAGRIRAGRSGGSARLVTEASLTFARMFAVERPAHCSTHF
ncbi:GNAT family N-acetyltransferase [Sinomonas sp. ASV486]|uniref:GNAT family N-acetyltransferase n=1 Tax=Sinomonas sp. ASV486 TaxID=3051170 RepID=UPI0027DC16F6|nr:GNAT family N-acetyltransferase [Sinomonas sp. ASV486]MDQ4489616.1 GNAT family N-acetyltransferase [Sinomonas sp. ASV486]